MRFSFPVFYTCLLSSVLAAPAATVPASPVFAGARAEQDARKPFDIAAADGAVALEVFADQANIAIVYLVEHVRGVKTNAVRGEFTPREALERLVANTVLAVVKDAGTGALTIHRSTRQPPVPPPQPKSPAELTEKPTKPMKSKNLLAVLGGWLLGSLSTQAQNVGTTTPPGANKEDAPMTMSVFEVVSTKDEGYLSTQAVAGSRTIELLRDTPNSISVMNRELMDDLNVTNIDELAEFAVTGQKSDQNDINRPFYVFRGINANVRLRNGVKWYAPIDSYNIERVEVLRGPNAFLYGEVAVGGAMNQLTKKAQQIDFQRLNLIVGSHELYRAELDLNRRLHDTLAVRFNFAVQDAGGFMNHTKRDFRGGHVAVTYRPFKNTEVNLSVDRVATRASYADGILSDAFSNTERLGTTVAYTATTGGMTLIPATGRIYHMAAAPAQRRSSGTNTAVFDERILPRKANYYGPNSYFNNQSLSINASVAQKIGENLNIQLAWTHHNLYREDRTNRGSSSAGIYLDTNRTLPGAEPNPYFNEYYTEYNISGLKHRQVTADARITAVYDLKLPFTTQKIVLTALHQYDIPDRQTENLTEFIAPDSPLFTGSLINANTLEAYRANLATLNANRLYRRFYLRDGDGAHVTHNTIVPGQSAFLNDIAQYGAEGRLSERIIKTPAVGFGLSGSYFKGRLRTLVGARRDWFWQITNRALYNHFTDEEYPHPNRTAMRVKHNLYHDSVAFGGVYHLSKMLSLSFNYSEAQNVSAGMGGEQLIPGTFRGQGEGEGLDYGLRWSFLGGKIESNWTYYETDSLRQAASPGIPNAVRNELTALFTDINPTGGDRQAQRSTGLEFETIANVTRNWRLIWNLSTTDMETFQRYPALRHYQGRAKAENRTTPETDAFLETVPDGTPVPGFTKMTSNLVTNFRFSEGPLRGVSLGGGFQYRDRSYRGNFDFDRDGVAERVYTPSYVLANLSVGYRAKIVNRPTTFSLNVNNVFDKENFKSRSIGTGSWGDGRNFRLAIRTEL